MKLKFILIFILIPILTYAQEKKPAQNENQGVQLPDFVITGVRKVSIPIMKKKKPDLIPVLSKKFFTPALSSEMFLQTSPSILLKIGNVLKASKKNFNSQLKLGFGIYTEPTGEFNWHKNISHTMLFTKIWGLNQRNYTSYSNYNTSGILGGINFFLSKKSSFLPGLKISFLSNFSRDSYFLFGSKNPSLKREKQNGFTSIKFISTLNKRINYKINLSGKMLKFQNSSVGENNFKAKGYLKLRFQSIEVKINGLYHRQDYTNFKNQKEIFNFYSGHAGITIKPFNSFLISFGTNYALLDTNKFIAPTISFRALLDKNISLFGVYSPSAKFLTLDNFISQNRYLNIRSINNLFLSHNSNFKFAVKYQYGKYFEISLGAGYDKFNKFPYFEDKMNRGNFKIYTAVNVKKFESFLNFLFYPGPLGMFYGNITIQSIKDSNMNVIPYNPFLSTELVYGYNLNSRLEMKLVLNYDQNIYTQLNNKTKLNNYFNLSFNADYSLSKKFSLTLKLDNLLNRNNYYYHNYLAKPFDTIIGINYRW